MEEVRAVITQERAKISCNFEQVEKAIEGRIADYKGIVFTEDSKVYAKKDVASLRAQKKELQDSLRDEKKKYMQPWDEFEVQAKKLISMYDEPIELINEQLQAFEENRIAKKREVITKIYKENVFDEVAEVIPLDRIYNPKWENATFKEKDIRAEIKGAAEKAQNDIHTISIMESESVPMALAMYRKNLDLTEAVSYINSYERQRQEILAKEQERKRIEEEERVRREEREKVLAEQRAKEAQAEALRQAEIERQEALRQAEKEKAAAVEQAREQAAQEVIDSLIPDEDEETELYEYRISLSADAKKKLEMYMDSVGIEWEMM